ncbi:amino acid ABC transporter substrate-binding protein [Sagittula sp. NFXS13]|uniref:ABC transporter substrate-binding protein n=1 Tax=Sagittula sp. NFXS13 TaxID=2819095 RepID=UPI0032DE5FB0
MKLLYVTVASLALSAPAFAQNDCATGQTLSEGTLTIATGNPAFYPWVLDDAPASGEGFEAAVAHAIAANMGFEPDAVEWTRSSFDQAIQPGAKDFDITIQQFSITPEREEVVDFSIPYYTSAMAVLTTQSVVDNGAEATLDSLKTLTWGADANTTAVAMLADLIAPQTGPMLYNDNVDVTAAMQAGQIDAALFDLPTALYLSAVVLPDGTLLGQFPADRTESPDQFGMLMANESPLKPCVDAALQELIDDGTLAAIETQWLEETTGVPVIK